MNLKSCESLLEKARAAKANLDQEYYQGRCVECGFDFAYRHKYGCSIPEEQFSQAATPFAIEQLVQSYLRSVALHKEYLDTSVGLKAHTCNVIEFLKGIDE